jgi:hypothetical protein
MKAHQTFTVSVNFLSSRINVLVFQYMRFKATLAFYIIETKIRNIRYCQWHALRPEGSNSLSQKEGTPSGLSNMPAKNDLKSLSGG